MRFLNANPYAYLDDAPLEERRARAVNMRRVLPESVLEEVGRLDQAAIDQVREESWPDVRDADELHDTLLTLIAIPEEINKLRKIAGWSSLLTELAEERRAGIAGLRERNFWMAAEKVKSFRTIYPQAIFQKEPADVQEQVLSFEEELTALIKGWMMHLGPTTAAQLAQLLGLAQGDIEQSLLRLEASGTILRGRFTDSVADETEWCDRRLLARIHRLTLGRLRKEVEPVSAAQFFRWLLHWQHVAPGTQLSGEHGLFAVLRQLQGFEVAANAWEQQILAHRLRLYDQEQLDQLCMTGLVGWGRLSPHPATLDPGPPAESTATDVPAGSQATARSRARATGLSSNDISNDNDERGRRGAIRRVIPTSVAPITFFVREEADWMMPKHSGDELSHARVLSHAAQAVLAILRQRGACFFTDLVRATGHLKSEVETALWELVTAGLVTADGFDNLRALIDPRRRAGQGRSRSARPRHSTGRWSLLHTDADGDRTKAIDATCWLLLKRYGIVFRDLLARETITPRWRELLMAFRRLEERGEIRGGRFVSGFLGEQFALPVAVEGLRAMRKREPSGELVTLSAADPLNLVGILLPGEKIPAVSGRFITFRDGLFVDVGDSPRRIQLAPQTL